MTTPLGRTAAVLRRSWQTTEDSTSTPPLRLVGLYLLSIVVALLLTGLLVVLVHHSALSVFKAIYTGSLDGIAPLGQTLTTAVPVLVVGLGTLVAVRAGMFNIGQTGQLLLGATAAGFIALKLHGSGPLLLVLALACSALAGALWAAVSALLKLWRNIDVVLSTLLLGYVGAQILAYVVSSPALLREPNLSGNGGVTQSAEVPPGVRLPQAGHNPGFSVSSALFIGLALLVAFALLMTRTSWGLRLRMVGRNPVAARRFGVRIAIIAGGALVISGALAGLTGGMMLTSGAYGTFRLQPGFDNNFGNDGLLAALVCQDRPWALLPVSFFFGVIINGANYFLATGVPSYLGQILQSLLVLAAVFPSVFLHRRQWVQRLRQSRSVPLLEAA